MNRDFFAVDIGGDLDGGLLLVVATASGEEDDQLTGLYLDGGTLNWMLLVIICGSFTVAVRREERI